MYTLNNLPNDNQELREMIEKLNEDLQKGGSTEGHYMLQWVINNTASEMRLLKMVEYIRRNSQ